MRKQTNDVILSDVERAKALTEELAVLIQSESFRRALIEESTRLAPSLKEVIEGNNNISLAMENILISSFVNSEIISPISKAL